MTTTTKAQRFLDYWRQYRPPTEMDTITARAQRTAHRDGRTLVCLNDVEAAWSAIVGPLAVYGS